MVQTRAVVARTLKRTVIGFSWHRQLEATGLSALAVFSGVDSLLF